MPWPYGWFSSAGLAANFTPIRTIAEVNISVRDSIASAIRANVLPRIPAAPFITTRITLVTIPRSVVFTLMRLASVAVYWFAITTSA